MSLGAPATVSIRKSELPSTQGLRSPDLHCTHCWKRHWPSHHLVCAPPSQVPQGGPASLCPIRTPGQNPGGDLASSHQEPPVLITSSGRWQAGQGGTAHPLLFERQDSFILAHVLFLTCQVLFIFQEKCLSLHLSCPQSLCSPIRLGPSPHCQTGLSHFPGLHVPHPINSPCQTPF